MEYVFSAFLGVAMAVDCMCVGISDGMLETNMKKRKMFFIAILFGLMQGLMPLLGYLLGSLVQGYITNLIPYISFAILFILGAKAIIEAIIEQRKEKKNIEENKEEKEVEKKKLTIVEILVQSVATSIDAFAVGFTFVDRNDSLYSYISFGIIAVITFGLTITMIILGRKIGEKVSKLAPYFSGVIFIALALKFLISALI
jgi:manganese efflux pump family protein